MSIIYIKNRHRLTTPTHTHVHTQACPLFGKLSDVVGRRTGLFLTVMGTTLPITMLALTQSMWIYAVAQGLSGIFASTFTITFAYIADLVEKVGSALFFGAQCVYTYMR